MANSDPVEDVISELRAARANVSCSDMARLLESLGFKIRDAKKEGHKLYFHDSVDEFYSSSYSCGHGKNPIIKSAYVSRVITVLRKHKVEVLKFLGGENER